MNFNCTEIHKTKIEQFALTKPGNYKQQIEDYLHHFALLTGEAFPLKPYVYIIYAEYPDTVLVRKLDEDEISKHKKKDLIFVNQRK